MKPCKCGNTAELSNGLCLDCNKNACWKQWEFDEAPAIEAIKALQKEGHSHHCACRIVFGDDECECDLYQFGYDPCAFAFNMIDVVKNKDQYRYQWE